MDKSWIDLRDRCCRAYFEGVDSFLTFAFNNVVGGTKIFCPCKKCQNRYLVSKATAREHLVLNGFLQNYKKWTFHGESYAPIESNQHDQHFEVNISRASSSHIPNQVKEELANMRRENQDMRRENQDMKRENQGLRELCANLQEDYMELRNQFNDMVSFLTQNFPSFANGTVQVPERQIPDASSGHQDFFSIGGERSKRLN